MISGEKTLLKKQTQKIYFLYQGLYVVRTLLGSNSYEIHHEDTGIELEDQK